MLAADAPVVSSSPIQLTNPDTGATTTIHTPTSPADPAITFNFGTDSPAITFTPSDLASPGSGGSSTSVAGGGGIPARIVSGSGSAYTIDLYENGPSARATNRVAATQLQIAAGEAIPAGTSTLASKIGGAYYICVPVWQ